MRQEIAHQEFLVINLLKKSQAIKISSRFFAWILLAMGVFLSALLQGALIKKWEKELDEVERQKQQVVNNIKQALQLKQNYEANMAQLNQLTHMTNIIAQPSVKLIPLFEFFTKSIPKNLFLTAMIWHEPTLEVYGIANSLKPEQELLVWMHQFPSFAKVSLRSISYSQGQYKFFIMASLP